MAKWTGLGSIVMIGLLGLLWQHVGDPVLKALGYTHERHLSNPSQQMPPMVDSNWVFNRLKDAPGYEDEIRNFVGHSRRLPNSATVTWEPIYSHIFILQIPVVTLKTSIVLFFVGLWVSVWDAAMRKHLKIDTPEFKVRHTSSSMDIPRLLMTNVHF
jgi:hypothetical protein